MALEGKQSTLAAQGTSEHINFGEMKSPGAPGELSAAALDRQISSSRSRSDIGMDAGVLDSLKRLRGEVCSIDL